MRTRRKCFADKKRTDDYYDLYEDYDLIEASFAEQYGIRLRREDDMPWGEFCSLLSGLLPDTPLGKVVSIRAEKDSKILKTFTKEQKKIRSDWQRRKMQKLKEDPAAYKAYVDDFQAFCKSAFGKKK